MTIANYAQDPALYEKCMNLLDSCFPGIKAIADKGRNHDAYWDKSSTPFIITKQGELIAHLGVLPFEMLINQKTYHGAALHGICTKEAYRRKGYFRQLMTEALSYVTSHFDFAFLFTDQPFLYEQFGFKVVKEVDFIYDFHAKPTRDRIRQLNLDNKHDLNIFQSTYLNRLPLSSSFSIVKEVTVATLNAMHQPVHYIEDLETLVVYQVKDRVLYVKDIISTKPCDLAAVLNSINEPYTKVILQFIPDALVKEPFNTIEANTDGCIMMKDLDPQSDFFRYPEPQRC